MLRLKILHQLLKTNLKEASMSDNPEKIRISWDDVEKAEVTESVPMAIPVTQPRANRGGGSWGTIAPQGDASIASAGSGGSVLLKGWFYLGMAGLLGAFLAWIFCEPTFEDGAYGGGWGQWMMFPLMMILMCIGFGSAESLVERTWKRAFLRGLASTGLGLVLGFIFYFIANVVYGLLTTLLIEFGAEPLTLDTNPMFWLVRGFAWSVFGMAGGLIFGIVSKSGRKTSYGMLGGVIGAGLGGFLFDPIALITQAPEASRAIGMSILGASTGVAIGLVESALKDRWLYVSGGPLAGKQFVLYQDVVTLGRNQSSTIYLFKDLAVLDQHATITRTGGRSVLTALGPVSIGGQLLQPQMRHTLQSGDVLRISQYVFTYAEKDQAKKKK
jgi:hypothetical protein